MKGEFGVIWKETREDLWDKLAALDGAPDDLYCELLRAASNSLICPSDSNELNIWQAQLEEAFASPELSKANFHKLKADDFKGEKAICNFFEDAYEALNELSDGDLARSFSLILNAFIKKYNLRYELLPPCRIIPTIPGIFSSLIEELRRVTACDLHLEELLFEFENSVRDLMIGTTEGKIKTCIQKQINLLEGIAQLSPLVTKGDLAGMCGELKSWPHLAVKTSIASLYSFASEYPGIRHGGKPDKALRKIALKDFISIAVLLTGCLPYLSDSIDPEAVLWRQ
ncbi:MAG TPA: hypothetical protein VFW49_01020 [Fluviicoccus sp.]|nr:hypothetical protein [Fluviicoccus sp.]